MTVPDLLQFSLVHRHYGPATPVPVAPRATLPIEERYWSVPLDRWVTRGRVARRLQEPVELVVEAPEANAQRLGGPDLSLELTDSGTWLAGVVERGAEKAGDAGVWLSWLTFTIASSADTASPADLARAREEAQALLADLRHWAPAYPGHALLRLAEPGGWSGTMPDLLERWLPTADPPLIDSLYAPVFDQRLAVIACVDVGADLPGGEALRSWLDIDPPSGMQASKEWTSRWLEGRVYDRWSSSGVVHGFTHHSAVALHTGAAWLPGLWRPRHPVDGPRGPGCYFDMALMVLGQCALETAARQTAHEGGAGVVGLTCDGTRPPFAPPAAVTTPIDQGRAMHGMWSDVARRDLGLGGSQVPPGVVESDSFAQSSLGAQPLGVLNGYEEDLPTFGESNFTVFIAPFRYEVAKAATAGAEGLCFRPSTFDWSPSADDSDLWRREYLTGETRAVFFPEPPAKSGSEQDPRSVDCETRWFELTVSPDEPASLTLSWTRAKGGGTLALPVRVRLVLFDFQSARDSTAADRALSPHEKAGCIGMLLVDVSASEGMTVDDLLDLNAHFRLLRYQHAGQPGDLQKRMGKESGDGEVAGPTLPCCKLVGMPERRRGPAGTDALAIPMWEQLASQTVVDDGRCLELMHIDFGVHPDNRAFVLTHLTLPRGTPWAVAESPDALGLCEDEAGGPSWMLWRQLLEVEGAAAPGRGRLTSVEDDWTERRTYWRWADAGTSGERLYGYSNFSFASMCSERAWAVPRKHMRGIYMDQTLLALYQRAAVFSFGWELSVLTQRWKRGEWKDVQSGYRRFREHFAQFVNLYWYPAFTNQMQGLEMYELMRREFDSAVLFDELRVELETTGAFLEGLASEDAARRVSTLTWIAAGVAAAGLALAFLGTNLLVPGKSGGLVYASPPWWVWLVFGVIVFAVVPLLLVILWTGRKLLARIRRDDPQRR